MSRYHLTPPDWPAQHSFVIGWDDALGSYFALVLGVGNQLIAAVGDHSPPFTKLDNLMRVINSRIKGQLPPVQLTGELRRALAGDAKRTVVNSLTITLPGEQAPPRKPVIRAAETLGMHVGFLNADGVRDELEAMAELFFRLEETYRASKAAGMDGETIRGLHTALGSIEIVCNILGGMAQTPNILVAAIALEPFHALAADAERLLHGEAAVIPSPILH